MMDYLTESIFFLLIATDKTKNVNKNSRSPDYSSWMEPIQQQFDLYRSHIDGNNSRSDIWDRNIYGIHHVFYRLEWLLYFCLLSTEKCSILTAVQWFDESFCSTGGIEKQWKQLYDLGKGGQSNAITGLEYHRVPNSKRYFIFVTTSLRLYQFQVRKYYGYVHKWCPILAGSCGGMAKRDKIVQRG